LPYSTAHGIIKNIAHSISSTMYYVRHNYNQKHIIQFPLKHVTTVLDNTASRLLNINNEVYL